jgi:hypothetical protein
MAVSGLPANALSQPLRSQAQAARFLMNQVLVKTPGGWRVSSILPIPAPAQ